MKYQTRLQIFLTFVLFIFYGQAFANGETLNKIWETDGFMNPESVVYDKNANVLYVSNVNGDANAKDGNGFISRVSLDGEILDEKWVTGLNAPKGLDISGNKLYAADIDTLVEIDIPSASITHTYQVPDAKFLNDVAAGNDGKIYVSDMVLNRIHMLDNGKFSIWLESPDLQNPNGLLVQGDSLIEGAWGVMTDGFNTDVPGHLKSISLKDKSITIIGDGSSVGNMDGVESDGKNGYYVTDWMAGKLFHIGRDGNVSPMLTLEKGMADLEYINDRNLLILPMMMGNKLMAYKTH